MSASIGTIYIHCHIKFSACSPDFCVSLLNSHSEHGIINIDDQKCRLLRYMILLLMKSIFDLENRLDINNEFERFVRELYEDRNAALYAEDEYHQKEYSTLIELIYKI